jgi:hypothetical protein
MGLFGAQMVVVQAFGRAHRTYRRAARMASFGVTMQRGTPPTRLTTAPELPRRAARGGFVRFHRRSREMASFAAATTTAAITVGVHRFKLLHLSKSWPRHTHLLPRPPRALSALAPLGTEHSTASPCISQANSSAIVHTDAPPSPLYPGEGAGVRGRRGQLHRISKERADRIVNGQRITRPPFQLVVAEKRIRNPPLVIAILVSRTAMGVSSNCASYRSY